MLNQKKVWLLITSIFLIAMPSISAYLSISPSTTTADVFINHPKVFDLTLTNHNTFDIYNIGFTDTNFVTLPTISKLEVNESVKINITVLADIKTTQTLTSTCSYYYYLGIPTSPETYYINITNVSFIPHHINISIGDTITWKNIDDVIHSVTNPPTFDKDLNPNETWSYTFNQQGYYDVLDIHLGLHNLITVSNISASLIHDNDKDRLLTINLQSFYKESTINLELIENNFTISYDSYKEGILKITNAGNQTAINITLKSNPNWITFEKQNFNLTKDQYTYVNYILQPIILNESETNKSYDINIDAKSSNTPTANTILNVFIPYEEFVIPTANLTNAELIELIKTLQKQLAEIDWGTDQEVKIIYRDTLIGINYTEKDVYEMMRNYLYLKDDVEKSLNTIKPSIDTLITNFNTDIPEIKKLINQSTVLANQNKNTIDNTITYGLTTIIILMIIGGGFAIYFIAKKIYIKKYRGALL